MTHVRGEAAGTTAMLASRGRRPRVLLHRSLAAVGAITAVMVATPDPAGAQTVGQVFRRVKAAVVTIRTTERDPSPGGQASVPGVGSGVLVSRDGRVMTAAHVVQTADEIVVHFSKSGGFEGLGFVVKPPWRAACCSSAARFLSGLSGKVVTGEVARALNLPQNTGVLIERVAARSPAALLGLRGGTVAATIAGSAYVLGGDVLLDVFGIGIGDLSSYEQIQARLAAMKPGDEVALRILRGGRVLDLRAPLP